jgi:quercetin dioxygenase-like cupin family protein
MTPGQKAGLLLEGRVKLSVAGTETVLEEGDSFQFDSTLPHGVHNESANTAKVLWMISPHAAGIAI